MKNRDIEKSLSKDIFIAKIRRLLEVLEEGKKLEIQVSGERIYVPVSAEFSIEHEREGSNEELEFQIKWKN